MEQSYEALGVKALFELALKETGREKVEQVLRTLISEQKRGRPDLIEFIIENANRKREEQPLGIIAAINTVRKISNATWYRLLERKNEIPEDVFDDF